MTTVQTVTGPIDSADMGVCLPHEHIINDVRSWHTPSTQLLDAQWFANAPVSMDILWELRQDPFGNIDNCFMADVDLAIHELDYFRRLGGQTILDATSVSIGRNLPVLRDISQQTGLTIIAGTGFYLDSSQPEDIKALGTEEIAEIILRDLTDGVDGVRPGFIGEIGVSADFTPAERKSLEAACIAQVATGLPMQVHLPGWFRLGHEVLDIVESRGVNPNHVVLCHMGPSGHDLDYQSSLAKRGAWIQHDMIGMEVFYADQGVQCPSDEDNARHLLALCDAGHQDRVLISQDIFMKSLLRRFGGPGYGHILQFFIPRLRRMGADDALIDTLIIHNPRHVFDISKENHHD